MHNWNSSWATWVEVIANKRTIGTRIYFQKYSVAKFNTRRINYCFEFKKSIGTVFQKSLNWKQKMGSTTGQTDGLVGSRLRNEQWGWNLAVKSEDSIHVVREVYQFSKLLMQIFFISNRMLNILFNAMTLLYLTLSASFHIVQFIIANAIRM